MAADFNAGSIEGTLDLNTAPFAAGLRRANAQAAEFEHKKVSATADLDTVPMTAKKDKADAELDLLGHKKVTAKADLNITEALAKAALLNKVLDAGGLGGKTTGIGGMLGKLALMPAMLMSVAAAAGPAGAALTGLGAAGMAAFGGLAISLGLFAKVVSSDMTKIQKAIKSGIQLSGPAGAAEIAMKHLTKAWADFQKASGNVGYKVLTTAFTGLAGILPKLVPLLKATGNGVNDVLQHVFALTRTPLFGNFIKELTAFMHGFLAGAGPVIENLLATFMHLFIALQPVMAILGGLIVKASNSLEQFSERLDNGGIKPFVSYLRTVLPELGHMLGAVITGLMHLAAGLAPLSGPALHFIGALVTAIGHLNIAPLAKGLGEVLGAIEPLLPIAGQLINVVLKPLGALLSGLAHGPLHALTHSLSSELQPAFHALSGILRALVKPLTAFIGSIANLANPTGVHLVATLLKALEKAVKTVAPAFGHLAVALESVIDDGINVITPLIPKLTPLLNGVAHAAAFFANSLAKILSHKSVALTILGIVGAVKAYKLAMSGWNMLTSGIDAMTAAWGKLKDMAILTRIQLALLKAQEIAVAVWGKVVAAAEKVWAAVQWVLDAALDANPIGIVVVAIGALVAALIYAWEHSKKFREIVTGVFNAVKNAVETACHWIGHAVSTVVDWIKNHWQLLLGILMGPVGIAVAFIISHWNQIKTTTENVFHAVVDFISNAIHNIISFFTSLPGRISSFAGNMLHAGIHFFSGIFDGIKQIGADIIHWCEQLPGRIIGAIGNIGAKVASSVKGSISGALSGVGHFVGGLVPHFATGTITNGPMHAVIGDNPGGHEAVIPLDKYDLPKRGETAALASRAQAANDRIVELLARIAGTLAGQKEHDPQALADALSGALAKHSDATARKMIQIARAT